MNPVAADLVKKPEDYRWSSARAHLSGQNDELVQVAPLLDLIPGWKSFLQLSSVEEVDQFQRHERTGRPLSVSGFVDHLEQILLRPLKPQKPGPKVKSG